MRQTQLISLAAMAAISGYASTSHAHFKLLSPGSWLMEDASGGPQKGSPCGVGGADDVNPPPLTNKVTEYHAGEEIEVKWVDTIAHPGHFRIALAEKREDLKDPTIKQDSFCSYDESMVPKEASGNVLADGVSFRSRTGFSAQAGTMFSQKVKLPDTPCEKCTLQVMQIMENDIQSISNCYYFHCADIKILPAAGGATAGSGAAGSSAAPAGASGATATAGAGGSSAAGAGAGGSSAGASGASGTAAGASGSVGAAGAAGSARAGSPATSTTAGSSASAAGSTSSAAGSLASSGAAGAAGTPATGTTTNAATGTGATSGDSSGCSVNGAGAASNASSAVLIAGAMLLMNARRRRRQPARCASSKPRR